MPAQPRFAAPEAPPDGLPAQARALGDPTRYAIFRAVVDAPAPLDVPALTERFGCNHNAVRQHLRKLVDAGLVIEEQAPAHGPGRPRLRYRVDPAADARWGARSGADRIVAILADAVRTGLTAREAGRAAGAGVAAATSPSDPIRTLVEAMAREGFAPEVVERRDGSDVLLHVCPFPIAAAEAPDVVCAVHRGLAEGILDACGTGVAVAGLDARDPHVAGCRLRLRRARSG